MDAHARIKKYLMGWQALLAAAAVGKFGAGRIGGTEIILR